MEKYKIIKNIGSGAFSTVLKAHNTKNNEIVAIKKMKDKFPNWDDCINLREVQSLRKLVHPNIIKLKEVLRQNDELSLVFEFGEKTVYQFYQEYKIKGQQIPEQKIKNIIYQTLQGLAFMHKHGFFHRDMKPENLLYLNGQIKIADFGLAREIRSRPPFTDYVSTRWYRAPELILKSEHYNSPIDIFALGCIMAELFVLCPVFTGSSSLDQLNKICSKLGTPTSSQWKEGYKLASQMGFSFPQYSALNLSEIIPNASYEALEVIKDMLKWDSSKRPSAQQLLEYSYFRNCQMEDISQNKLTLSQVNTKNQSKYSSKNVFKQAASKNINQKSFLQSNKFSNLNQNEDEFQTTFSDLNISQFSSPDSKKNNINNNNFYNKNKEN